MALFDQKIPLAPIFRPSVAEFADFKSFVYGLSKRKDVQTAGCAKVIPPSNFKFNAMSIEAMKKELTIPRPLEQQVLVGRGFYDLRLVQRKAMTVGEYKALVDKDAKLVKGKRVEEVEKQVS